MSSTVVNLNTVWSVQIGQVSNGAYSVLKGQGGSVYVAGDVEGNLDGQINQSGVGGKDGYVIKFDNNGAKLWTRLIGGTVWTGVYGGSALAEDSTGNILVAGMTYGQIAQQITNGSQDLFVAKYSQDGTKLWSTVLGTSGGEQANSIFASPNGTVFVSGYTYGSLGGESNSGGQKGFLSKLDVNGTLLWTRLLGTELTSVAGSTDGSSFVAGYQGGGPETGVLSKYSSSGQLIWNKSFGGKIIYGLEVLQDGSIFATGLTRAEWPGAVITGTSDAFLMKLDAFGETVWIQQIGGSSANEVSQTLAVTSSGGVVIAGNVGGPTFEGITAATGNIFVSKYEADGTKTWSGVYPLNGSVSSIALISDDAIVLSGGSNGSGFVSRLSASNTNQTSTNQPQPICFARGTQINTAQGLALVESLNSDATVIDHDGKATNVKWIGYQRRTPEFAQFDDYLPVKICAGALEENVPVRDLYLSPDHAVLVDGHLIHAQALVNGRTIIKMTEWQGDIEYYHIETKNHEIIFAEGVPCETFIDNVSREQFDNYAEYQALYPYTQMMRELPLPRVKFRRQMPSAIWRRLIERADLITAAQDQA
jgi:hypothetical protein